MRFPRFRLDTLMIGVALLAIILAAITHNLVIQSEVARAAARVRMLRAEAMVAQFRAEAALQRRIAENIDPILQALYESHLTEELNRRKAEGLSDGELALWQVRMQEAIHRAYAADLGRHDRIALGR